MPHETTGSGTQDVGQVKITRSCSRPVICSTNAIESINARIREAVRARGHFPNEQAALKWVFMTLISLDPTGKGHRRWTMR